MRIVVVILAILNLVMAIWGGLGYWYSMGQKQALLMESVRDRPMPGKTLLMLRERQKESDPSDLAGMAGGLVDGVGEAAENLPGNVVSVTQNAAGAECIRLGPFKDAETAEVIARKLVGFAINSSVLSVEKVSGVDYWVYIQPQSTRELALAKLRELQDKKIDSFVIPQGELENGISLGVFDNESEAIKKQQEIAQQGYEAKVGPHDRKYNEYWLRIDQEAARSYTDEIGRQVQEGQGGMELHKESCGEVAPVSGIQ